jgi:hypothetical protein
LNNQAFAARTAVQVEMKRVFRDPEPATLSSVTVRKVQPGVPIDDMVAMVFIRDDLPKGSVQPATYLSTEESGGLRSNKRGERVLIDAGLLMPGAQMVPGAGLPLDAHKQPTGAGVKQMLSRLRAFSEVGHMANATDETRKKLIRTARRLAAKSAKASGADAAGVRAARAGAFLPIVNKTGNEFFLMKSKLTDGFAGVFKLVGRGNVEAVAWFTSKRPTYAPRFPFKEIVAKSAAASWRQSLDKAIAFVGGGSADGK